MTARDAWTPEDIYDVLIAVAAAMADDAIRMASASLLREAADVLAAADTADVPGMCRAVRDLHPDAHHARTRDAIVRAQAMCVDEEGMS